jgi:hypothetical protein
MIVAAGRPGGWQCPPRYGIKHGFVQAMTPVRVTFTVLSIGGPHPQIKACCHSIASSLILQRALSPPNGCLGILLRAFPRRYEVSTCGASAYRLRFARQWL